MHHKNKLFIQFVVEEISSGGRPWGERCSKEQRAAWHRFVASRLRMKKCIRCNNKHLPGFQCCKRHKEQNRKRCLAWSRKNRDYIRAKYQARRAAGVCMVSPDHGAVEIPTSPYCAACRARARKSKSKARR